MSITAVSNASNGTVVLDTVAGTITYTPNADYNGLASFDYTVSDGTDDTVAQVGIDVLSLLEGDANNNTLAGSRKEELIYGYGGNDLLWGRAGDDVLLGGAGIDDLRGGYHDDILQGGIGNDSLDGGKGNDTYQFTLGDGEDVIYNKETNDAAAIDRLELGGSAGQCHGCV